MAGYLGGLISLGLLAARESERFRIEGLAVDNDRAIGADAPIAVIRPDLGDSGLGRGAEWER